MTELKHTIPTSATAASPDRINAGAGVMFYTPAWPIGSASSGIVTYTHHMAQAMEKLGVHVHVLTGEDRSADRAAGSMRVSSLDQVLGPSSRRRRIVNALGWRIGGEEHVRRQVRQRIAQAARIVLHDQPVDVVEIEESFGLAKDLLNDADVPVVIRIHGPWFLTGRYCAGFEDAASQRRIIDEGAAVAVAAGVTSPSAATLSALRRHYGLELPHAAVIPNPVPPPPPPPRRWRAASAVPGRILFVGRLDELKGADVMLRAFAQLARDRPAVSLMLVGADGAIGDEWRQLAGDALPRVQFMERQPPESLDQLRMQSMVTVVPSRYEVFGMTAVEAMRLGSPVVVSNVGGLAEIMQHGRNGLVFDPGNADDLATQIGDMLDYPHRAAEMGAQAAVDCAQRYHPIEVARQTLEFYAEVLARRRRGGKARS